MPVPVRGHHPRPTTRFRALALAAAAAAFATALTATPASSAVVDAAPPGANDWSCRPTAEHPDPVVLVPGTFEDMLKNWSTLSPYLADQGYCVFALNYGDQATGPVADSARELAPFVDAVLAATGARQVDVVGHSQGGMMPRYWIQFLGGAKKVDDLVGIAPSNHGTQGLIVPLGEGTTTGLIGETQTPCQACVDQQAGSAFLQELNAGGDTVRGVDYTVLSTRYDEVVTPYTSQFLVGDPARVTNLTIQDLCPLDTFEHDQMPNDPVVHQLVEAALATDGPAPATVSPACVPVP